MDLKPQESAWAFDLVARWGLLDVVETDIQNCAGW
jgi:hypothetical protein